MKQLIHKYLNTASLGIFDQVVVSGGNFLTGVLLARILGLEIFGEFTLIWMIILFALSLNMAFVSKPMLTLGSKKEDSNSYFQALHTLQLIIVGLSVVIVYCALTIAGILGLFSYSSKVILAVCLLVASQLLYDFYRKYFFVSEQVHRAVGLDVFLFGMQLSSIVILTRYGYASLDRVLILLGTLQLCIMIVVSLFVCGISLHAKEIVNTTITHIRFSGWLSLTAILQWITGNYYIIIAGGVLGTTSVGIVKIVQQLSGLCHILFLAMENLLPVAAAKKIKEHGLNIVVKFLKVQGIRWLIPLLLFISILLITGPILIKIIYKVELAENYFVLPGFAVLYCLVFLGIPSRIFFRTIEQTKPIFVAYILGAGFSLITAEKLLTAIGLPGLIIGLWMVQLITLMVYFFEFNKIMKYNQNSILITEVNFKHK